MFIVVSGFAIKILNALVVQKFKRNKKYANNSRKRTLLFRGACKKFEAGELEEFLQAKVDNEILTSNVRIKIQNIIHIDNYNEWYSLNCKKL